MEGGWRGLAGWLAALVMAGAFVSGATGCGGEDSGAEPPVVSSQDPERDFAPVVQLDAGERWRPMSGTWFIRHSARRRSDDNQLYYDLDDRRRAGPGWGSPVPVYTERYDEEVDGSPGVRLSYWMLYGMNDPGTSPRGGPAHEGDWERFEVLLQKGDSRGAYRPVAVRLHEDDGGHRDIAWDHVQRAGSGGRTDTHPLTRAERGSHRLTLGGGCRECRQWRTWSHSREASVEPWYGFDNSWGELGPDETSPGPLGPGALEIG